VTYGVINTEKQTQFIVRCNKKITFKRKLLGENFTPVFHQCSEKILIKQGETVNKSNHTVIFIH